MGQGSSSPAGNGSESGIGVSEELQAEILDDFRNQALKKEWQKYQTSILVHRNERSQQIQAKTQELEAQKQQSEAARAPRVQQTRDRWDRLQARFEDASVALHHDAQRVSAQYQIKTVDTAAESSNNTAELDSIPLPCLGPRAHWIDCQKKYAADPRHCDAYATALQQCVNQKILSKNSEHASSDAADA